MINEINHERWFKSLTKILEIHFRNSTLNNDDYNKINNYIHTKIIFGRGWDSLRGRITKSSTSDLPSTTDHQPPTYQKVLRRPSDHWPPTYRQELHRPTNHRQPTIDPLTRAPTTHWPAAANHQPVDKCSTDSPTTDHRLTDRSSTDPLITNSLTHRPYYNWPTTLWLTNLTLTELPWDKLFIYFYLSILSLTLTITEWILFTINNSNKMLIDVNTLVKKPIEHKTCYI